MKGQCLCGEIQFEIFAGDSNIYQCHCSLCRKVTGSNANSSVIVDQHGFKWLSGTENIASYIKRSGYRSDFCRKCGSPVPNDLKRTSGYWVPAGLLENSGELKVVAHVCTESKARWDQVSDNGVQFEGMPELETLIDVLQRTSQ